MSAKKALKRLIFWVGAALFFDAGIYFRMGQGKALEFLGGYIIEQSLSLDNLFLFLIIFSTFGIPPSYQKRALNYGIIGAVILRLMFVMLGVAIIRQFNWVLHIFGVILIISGIKLLLKGEKQKDFRHSRVLRFLDMFIPVSGTLNRDRFFVRKNGKLYATPLLAVLILVEGSDIVFAIDSIPAIFSITTDPFIVYTSNVFAVLSLRNMYFVLERVHRGFKYVRYGVAMILVFTGYKLVMLYFGVKISVIASLCIISGILAVSMAVSWIESITRKAAGARKRVR